MISTLYIKIRKLFKKFIFFIFSENSKIINIFVSFDIFLRRLGFLNNIHKGKFEFQGLTFYNDKNDIVLRPLLSQTILMSRRLLRKLNQL